MKLQKHKTRDNYYKYVVVLPKDKVEEAGFKEGDELKANAKKGKIILSK